MRIFSTFFAAILLVPFLACATQAANDSSSIPSAVLIQPAALAAALQNAKETPLILQVGFRALFTQAHIPGAQYAGPTSKEDGIANLKAHVETLPRDQKLVIYCGCCPWVKCPNIAAAYKQLHAMGFSSVEVLYIAGDFGSDWVDKGYPIERGD